MEGGGGLEGEELGGGGGVEEGEELRRGRSWGGGGVEEGEEEELGILVMYPRVIFSLL